MTDDRLDDFNRGPSATPNPLLVPVGPRRSTGDWPGLLAHDPLAGLDRRSLSDADRERLLPQIYACYEPTAPAIRLVARMFRMILAGYERRNPTIIDNRRMQHQVLALRGQHRGEVPWLPASADAMMLLGCAGLGKSHTVMRACSLMRQTYTHGASDIAGWSRHLQVTYLIVPMPANAGGLLFAILQALDQACGTSYATDYGRRLGTNERLAVQVGILLIQHFVGLLVIEEVQPRNFASSPRKNETLLMLLRLLNFGIPLLLVGNPLGFAGIEEHSQDARRLTAQDPVEMMPFEIDDADWTEGIAKRLWGQSVLPEQDAYSSQIYEELHACSAGIVDYAVKAMVGAQRIAMDSGDSRLTVEHLRRYRDESTGFDFCRDYVEGFAQKDAMRLSKYSDVPWQRYGRMWGTLDLTSPFAAPPGGSTSDPSVKATAGRRVDVHARARSTAAAKLTKDRKASASPKSAAGYSPDDLRSGARSILTQGLDELARKARKE